MVEKCTICGKDTKFEVSSVKADWYICESEECNEKHLYEMNKDDDDETHLYELSGGGFNITIGDEVQEK